MTSQTTFRALRPVLAVACLGAALSGPAFAAASTNTAADAEKVTWAEHVAPILYQRCAGCHRPGQTAPMSFLTYDEVRPWAKSIVKATHDRTMPPWFANPAHGQFVEDPRLSDEQLETIARWVQAGAPAGDAAKAPAPPTFSSEWLIGEPDVVFTMQPFEVTDEIEDHYQWLKVENNIDEDRWIKAFEVRPSFAEAVHHQLTYIGPPDATVQSVQGAGQLDLQFVGGWGPGVNPLEHPEGYGMLLPANSTVFFQMHYHKTPGPGTGGIDQSKVAMTFYDEKPENRITTLWIVDPALDIPPGEANYTSASSFTAEHDAVIFDFTPHMHLRGKAMRFTAEYPTGDKEILLDVVDYDFNWQLTYTPTKPVRIPAGTKIAVDALFDNSADNPLNPDHSIPVKFGEKTTDEMMVGFLHYSFVDNAQQDDMPTFSVPEHLRQGLDQVQRFRQQQREAKATAESNSGDE